MQCPSYLELEGINNLMQFNFIFKALLRAAGSGLIRHTGRLTALRVVFS